MSARVLVQVVDVAEDGSATAESWAFTPGHFELLVRRFTRMFGRPPMHSTVATAEAMNASVAAAQPGMVVVDHD